MDATALTMNVLLLLLPVWVQNGVSDKTAAIFPRIVPSALQLFEYRDFNVTCEGFFNSFTKWRVMRNTNTLNKQICSKSFETLGACHISASYPSLDSGEYWCETETKERSEKVNITVTAGQVILESPVRAVTVGDIVTLQCIDKNISKPRADFYKDGRRVNTSLTGEMTIQSISLSDGGRYSCNISEGERSAENLLRVKAVLLESPTQPVMEGEDVTLFCKDITTLSRFTSYFFRNSSVIGNSSTGNLTLRAVSKSDEGLYKCKTETEESEENWLAVQNITAVDKGQDKQDKQDEQHTMYPLFVLVPLLLLVLVLGLIYKKHKGFFRSALENTDLFPLHSGCLQPSGTETYTTVTKPKNKKRAAVSGECEGAVYSVISDFDLKEDDLNGCGLTSGAEVETYSVVKKTKNKSCEQTHKAEVETYGVINKPKKNKRCKPTTANETVLYSVVKPKNKKPGESTAEYSFYSQIH